MNLKNEKEMQFHKLFLKTITTKDEKELEIAEKEFEKFRKENPKLTDEI